MALIAGVILTAAFAVILLYIIATLITLGFWNLVLVPVFHIGTIEWWQALLVYLFIGLIVGAFNATTRSR